jgi:hypothetical protein
MESIDIQAFTYEHRHALLDDLTAVVCNCGGWIVDRRTLSPTNMEFRIEVQLRAILDIYAGILGTGVELTRPGHDNLTELCTRRKHRRITAVLGQVVSLRLEINFVDEDTLHSLLSSSSQIS